MTILNEVRVGEILKKFKECSYYLDLSDISYCLEMNCEELDALAHSAGYKDAASMHDVFKREYRDYLVQQLESAANKGDRRAKAFLKNYVPTHFLNSSVKS